MFDPYSVDLDLKSHSVASILRLHSSFEKDKRKVQGVPQSQATVLPRHQEEEETDKTEQTQVEKTYEKHLD